MAKLFDDNKAYVDMKLTAVPGESTALLWWFAFDICSLSAYLTVDFSLHVDIVLDAFSNLTQRFPNETVPPSDLQVFVNTYFANSGKEFEPWSPPDWHAK